jgi:hypothetical protein
MMNTPGDAKSERGIFDFITDEQLRKGLESDYSELLSASQVEAWKAVQVLAGSIIEAILVDYLMSVGYTPTKGKTILEMQLGDLITVCKAEGALTSVTENLSIVVQDYRNLIHAGRALRLKRQAARSTARVAHSLVEIIADEVGRKKQETYGYTAAEIVDKILRDHSAVNILSHLIKGIKQPIEMERLLTRVLPETYFTYVALLGDEPVGPTVMALERCFRPIFDAAPEDVKRKATENFVRLLREDSETNVIAYEESFFRCEDLRFLSADEADLVKQHVLSHFAGDRRHSLTTFLRVLGGIGSYLSPSEAPIFADAVCSVVAHLQPSKLDMVPSDMGAALAAEYDEMSPPAQANFARRYDHWIAAFGQRNQPLIVEALDQARRWWMPSS